jgi:hypothetical protein
MRIRAKQMKAFEEAAEESFVRRLSGHLLENYAKTVVFLPDKKLPVEELPDETLQDMVRSGIARARSHGISYESSIAAFTAVMFEIAPNFDRHRLSQVLLNDEEIDPNSRLEELFKVLTEKNWESIKEDYDAEAWRFDSGE